MMKTTIFKFHFFAGVNAMRMLRMCVKVFPPGNKSSRHWWWWKVYNRATSAPSLTECCQGGSRVRAPATWTCLRGRQPEFARRGLPEPGAGPWTPGRAGACAGVRTSLPVQRVWPVSDCGPRAPHRRQCLLGAGRLLQGAWGLSARPQNCSRNSGSSSGTAGDDHRHLTLFTLGMRYLTMKMVITVRPERTCLGMWLC